MSLSRRDLLALAGAGLSLPLGVSGALLGAATPAASGEAGWQSLLGISLTEDKHYRPRIIGRIPADLRGTLFRNGPGLFERNGVRKRHLLDGDGLAQAFHFGDSGVEYRARFVRTDKFLAESEKARYLHPTWSTRAPGGPAANLGGPILSQAGVTVVEKHGTLLAFDEVGLPYELDPVSLETTGRQSAQPGEDDLDWKAHTKTDGQTGDWVMFGQSFGRQNHLHFCVTDAAGVRQSFRRIEVPHALYLHDCFLTANHVIFVLHPVVFSPFPFLLGMRSFIDSLGWKPALGNRVIVVEKSGDAPPLEMETQAAFMWHGLNAHESGRSIVADFVGYDVPDHFIGEDPHLAALMEGRSGQAEFPGTLRRYRIDTSNARIDEQLLQDGSFEFPMIDPRVQGHAHTVSYMTHATGDHWHQDAVARVDVESGRSQVHRSGAQTAVGEPVFAPRPGGGIDEGWLLSLVLDGERGYSRLEILDAERVSEGPLATIELEHHVPISFHGWWQAQTTS